MSERNDGGPAMPYSVHMEGFDRLSFPSMSLRDWFAGQALSAMTMPDDGQYSKSDQSRGYPTQQARWRAAAAYRIADAMLAERSKP